MATDDEAESKGSSRSSFRNIFALGFVSFFTDVSTEMVLSLLPVFIVSLPGSGSAALGMIEGLAESLSYGMRVVSGIFSDKLRRRKIIILLGYGVSNLLKPFFAVVNNIFEAMAIRVVDRVGKGIRTAPRDALLSESVDEKRRGMAFGLHRTLDQTGAILGPLAASFLMYVTGLTIRGVFWLSLIPGVAALLVLFFFVHVSFFFSLFSLVFGVFFVTLILYVGHVSGATIYVDDSGGKDYTSIQAAIDNASKGDTIFVYNGIYHEQIIINKTINLTGENKNATIIDGINGTEEYIIKLTADYINISNFTISNCSAPIFGAGINLHFSNFSRINNNIFMNHKEEILDQLFAEMYIKED